MKSTSSQPEGQFYSYPDNLSGAHLGKQDALLGGAMCACRLYSLEGNRIYRPIEGMPEVVRKTTGEWRGYR